MKKIAVLILMMLLMAGSVYAEPSKPIAEAMNTPASSFDLYLYMLENECNKNFLLGEYKSFVSVSYDFADNLIIIDFHFDQSSQPYKDALEKDDKEKIEKLFRLAAKYFAIRLGLTEYKAAGILSNISSRIGYKGKDFDVKKFREEIIKRTFIMLSLASKEKYYLLKRNHHGEVFFTGTDHFKPTKKTK